MTLALIRNPPPPPTPSPQSAWDSEYPSHSVWLDTVPSGTLFYHQNSGCTTTDRVVYKWGRDMEKITPPMRLWLKAHPFEIAMIPDHQCATVSYRPLVFHNSSHEIEFVLTFL